MSQKDMFKQFTDKLDYPAIEKEILAFWQDNDIFHKSLEIRQNSPWFSFYDGPPTVNGKPGVHHLIARALKDMICRYKNDDRALCSPSSRLGYSWLTC